MKNKEKYKDKILEIALDHDVVAVDKNGFVVRCGYIPCGICQFNADDRPCKDEFMEWSEQEYIEPAPKLTKQDKQFLDGFEKIGVYIARDKSNRLFIHTRKPDRDVDAEEWSNDGYYLALNKDLFPFIKWEDEKPWSIADLKKLEVEDD